MRKVILLFGVLAVIALGWFLYFNEGDPIAFVTLYEVKNSNLANSLDFSGKVEPEKMYSVMSETGGTISSIGVSEGSHVKKNDVLFELDATQAKAQLQEAQLKYDALSNTTTQMTMAQNGSGVMAEEKAKLALALSQSTGFDYESLNEAFGSEAAEAASKASSSLAQNLNDIPDLSTEELSGLAADSQLEIAALAVQRLESLVNGMTYKSRIAGTVVAVNVNVGEVLSPGIPAMVIADTDNTLITGYVYEKDLVGLKEGMDVMISSGSKRYSGKLLHIGAAATDVGDAASFDTMTKIEIKPDDTFDKMIGAVVDIKIVKDEKKGVLSIPLDCLTDDNCVYVVDENGIAKKRAVVLGFEDESNAEVVRGLIAGDRVIMTPQNIKEGQHVSYDRGE